MSVDVLVALAREVAADLSAQARIESLPDDELAGLGLDEDDIRSIREGFFDSVLRLGLTPAESPGCCG